MAAKAYALRHVLLTEITSALGLSTGTLHESTLDIRGWIEIEVHPSEGDPSANK